MLVLLLGLMPLKRTRAEKKRGEQEMREGRDRETRPRGESRGETREEETRREILSIFIILIMSWRSPHECISDTIFIRELQIKLHERFY